MVSSFLSVPFSSALRVISMSFGLSSTRRILNGASAVSIYRLLSWIWCAGDGEKECRSLAGRRFHPNAAAVRLHHFLADGEAHTRAFILLAVVKALEYLEDLVVVLRIDADAVVPDREGEVAVLGAAADLDLRLRLIVVLDRI